MTAVNTQLLLLTNLAVNKYTPNIKTMKRKEWCTKTERKHHINLSFFPSNTNGNAPYIKTCNAVHIRKPLIAHIGHTKKKYAITTHNPLGKGFGNLSNIYQKQKL